MPTTTVTASMPADADKSIDSQTASVACNAQLSCLSGLTQCSDKVLVTLCRQAQQWGVFVSLNVPLIIVT